MKIIAFLISTTLLFVTLAVPRAAPADPETTPSPTPAKTCEIVDPKNEDNFLRWSGYENCIDLASVLVKDKKKHEIRRLLVKAATNYLGILKSEEFPLHEKVDHFKQIAEIYSDAGSLKAAEEDFQNIGNRIESWIALAETQAAKKMKTEALASLARIRKRATAPETIAKIASIYADLGECQMGTNVLKRLPKGSDGTEAPFNSEDLEEFKEKCEKKKAP